ncbi:MAG: hypothetical protein R2941_10070 [Desulfobacterales bacterium]
MKRIDVTVNDNRGLQQSFRVNVRANAAQEVISMLYDPTGNIQNLLTDNTISLEENQLPKDIQINVKDSDNTSLTVSFCIEQYGSGSQQYAEFQNWKRNRIALSTVLTTGTPPLDKTFKLSVLPKSDVTGPAVITVRLNDNINPVVEVEFIINVLPILPTVERREIMSS